MKQKDIYYGTLKQCKDIYNYKKFGEERYCPDFTIGGLKKSNRIEMGTLVKYVDEVYRNTVLIKVSDHRFIILKNINNKKDEMLVNLGISAKTVSDFPIENDDIYVDTNTLVPYYNDLENQNKKVKVKTLRKDLESRVGFRN